MAKAASAVVPSHQLSLGKRLLRNIKEHYALYLFALPAVLYFAVFQYGPMYGLQLAFKDFSAKAGIWGSEWIGFDHFVRFFSSYNFWQLIWNTVGINIYSILVSFPAPIILALLLNELSNAKFKKVVQMVTYAPHFISTVIVVGMLNIFFAQTDGFVNVLLSNLGLTPIPFLESNEWFKTSYVFSGIWQGVGWGSIIYIATLANVPKEQHEAATIDGASKLQRMWYVNVPAILPTATILLIMEVGKMMNVGFEKIFLMQNALNMTSSDVISTYVYRVGLINADFSFGTAVGLFNSVINCVLLLTFNKITKSLGQTSLW